MSNGLHTIVWTATDSAGFIEGLGSRYFTVSNGTAATSRVQALRSAAVSASDSTGAPGARRCRRAATGIAGRRGWGANAPWRVYPADASGMVTVQGQELDRFELQLNLASGEQVTGNVRVGDALQELPVGSTLDRSTGRFVWSPGVGFIGTYDLVFSRTLNGQVVQRQDVRIVLRPKTLGPQVVIDTPGGGDQVGQPFSVAGWAASLDATDGSGIDTIHVWAYPVSGAAPNLPGRREPGRVAARRRCRIRRGVRPGWVRAAGAGAQRRRLRPRGLRLEQPAQRVLPRRRDPRSRALTVAIQSRVPWNRDSWDKSRSAAPGGQGERSEHIGHM